MSVGHECPLIEVFGSRLYHRPIPVTDQVAGSLFPTACFRDLIFDPFCSRVSCEPNHKICRRPCPMIAKVVLVSSPNIWPRSSSGYRYQA
jgi:hypothetical protein